MKAFVFADMYRLIYICSAVWSTLVYDDYEISKRIHLQNVLYRKFIPWKSSRRSIFLNASPAKYCKPNAPALNLKVKVKKKNYRKTIHSICNCSKHFHIHTITYIHAQMKSGIIGHFITKIAFEFFSPQIAVAIYTFYLDPYKHKGKKIALVKQSCWIG
jgi:hypothetical protein